MRSIIIIINVTSFSSGEYITCKPTSLCKPCKLQSRPPDQHPRGMWGLGNFIINHPLLDWIITLLQITPSTPSAPLLGCWSGGSDWSLQGLHKEIGLHLICFLSSIKYSNAYTKIYIYHYVDTIDFILHHTSICRPCLDPKILHQKISHRMFGHMHGVLNKIYMQIFSYGWVVNREMNLMSLLNPWFATVML